MLKARTEEQRKKFAWRALVEGDKVIGLEAGVKPATVARWRLKYCLQPNQITNRSNQKPGSSVLDTAATVTGSDRQLDSMNEESTSTKNTGASGFKCPVVTVKNVMEHPNADRLDVATIGGYEVVVGKNSWKDGDQAVYLPEASVLPESLITELGLEGRLAGKQKDRVKAVKLRGVLSQGLLVPLDSPHLRTVTNFDEGDDLSDALGITKWEPPIPVKMQGQVQSCTWPSSFDVDSWQRPDSPKFEDGEPVRITEKLHGTFCLLGWHTEHGATAASKGMVGRTSFKISAEENSKNLYCRAWYKHGTELQKWCEEFEVDRIEVLGEIVGAGVQDMNYGLRQPQFFGFGIRLNGETVDPDEIQPLFKTLGIESVPVLSEIDEYDHSALLDLALSKSSIPVVPDTKQLKHTHPGLREGIVVQSCIEPEKRVKYINPDYLIRRDGTEYN